VRSYQSIFFRAKVVTLVLAGLNAFVFIRRSIAASPSGDRDPVPRARRGERAPRSLRIALAIIVVVAGRMIAYNWFDCGQTAARPIVNALAGCVVRSR